MRHNILLGVTGSVAAVKATELAEALLEIGDVKLIATKAARFFLKQQHLPPEVETIFDEAEWPDDYRVGDPIPHIELRRWAGCLILAPLDANTLAKLSMGLCDNLLTCVYRAWDWTKPVIVAPAMNTLMWHGPTTKPALATLRTHGVRVVDPVVKRLACDDVGMGAMASVEEIVKRAEQALRWVFPLRQCAGIPINHHPGAFGFHRRKNHHTGVDLYCKDRELVSAVEDGTVVKVDYFTGPKVGHDWWEETFAMMVEGPSGVVNYGEIMPHLEVGSSVSRGSFLGYVKRVLFEDRHRPDIPGHSTAMLHLELYKHGTREFADWHDESKNPQLLDPTPYLMAAAGAPTTTLTWDNAEAKSVG